MKLSLKHIILTMVMTITVLLGSVCFSFADNTITSGTTGNLTWRLSGTSTDMVLTISGSGTMPDYQSKTLAPWQNYKSNIKKVVIGNGVTSIGNFAFYECTNLSNITIPNSVTSIGGAVLYNCRRLTSLTIPNSVTSINVLAFYGCSGLKSLTIPNSVNSIGDSALQNCTSLQTLSIPFTGNSTTSSNKYLGRIFAASSYTSQENIVPSSLKNVIITGNIKEIPANAFYKCKNIESITFPNTVREIGDSAFYFCESLKTPIVIPARVEKISANTFYGCEKLESITIPASVTSISSSGLPWEYSYEGIIYVEENSYAHKYVKEKGYLYDLLSGHQIKSWVITKAPTCTDEGVRRGQCSTCKRTVTESFPAKGHSWENEYRTDTLPTVSAEGSESIHCSVCGAIKPGSTKRIARISFSDVSIQEIPDQVYTGRRIEPDVHVYLGSEKLEMSKDYYVSYSNNVNVGRAQASVNFSSRFGNNSVTVYFNIIKNSSVSPGEMGYMLTILADKTESKRHLEGDRVTIFDQDEVVYMTFQCWEVVSGDFNLTESQAKQNPLTFTMPASDVKIRAVYSGSSLESELEAENNRHSAVRMKAASLQETIDLYTSSANRIKNKYGVSTLLSTSYYTSQASSTLTTLTKRQNYLATLKADTSGGHQVEIKQLEQEIKELQEEYQMYLELKGAAQYMEKAKSAQSELSRINLTAEDSLHKKNVNEICRRHGVTSPSVKEVKYINLDAKEYDYSGKAIYPKVTVVDTAGKIVRNSSYDVVYPKDCTSPGKHVLTLNFKGNYTGSKTKVFTIVKHNYGAWIVTKEATEDSAGMKYRVCINCKKKEYREIPPLIPTIIVDEVTPTNPVALAAMEKALTTAKSDTDPKGSNFGLLRAKGIAKSASSIKVSWKKVSGANAYIVYGNKCGKNKPYKRLKTVKSTSFTQSGLKKGKYYKYVIVAVRGNKAIATSKTIHVATKGGKVGNNKKVLSKVKKNKITIKKGKKFKLTVKAVPQSTKLKVKTHRTIAYETSNNKIATVSKKGVIKAKKNGKCKIYAYAQNGVCAVINVTVK